MADDVKNGIDTKRRRNVLITGCSSGFGFLTSLRLAEEGYRVYATMRNMKKSGPLLDAAAERNVSLEILRMDVTDVETIRRALGSIEEKDGRLDALINNAGYGAAGFFEDITDQEFRDQMETNFFGVLNVTRAALPLLRKSKKAKIINISSVSGFTAFPGLSPYHASKWALEGFSESLRFELRPFGVEVILIEPSAYRTKALNENTRFAAASMKPQSLYYEYSRIMLQAFQRRNGSLKNDANDVPERISAVLRRRRNKVRYIVGRRGKTLYWVRLLVPFRLMEWFINNYLFKKVDARTAVSPG